MPHRPCMEAHCGNYAVYRGRCRDHARARGRETHPNQDFYNSKRWKMTRRKQLFDHPLCVECGGIATDVDHIVPIEQGGARWSSSNLQSLCLQCHSKKTRAEQLVSA